MDLGWVAHSLHRLQHMMHQVLGTGYWLRLSLKLRLPKSCVVAAMGFGSSFVFGFGFGPETQSQWLRLSTVQVWKPLASVSASKL